MQSTGTGENVPFGELLARYRGAAQKTQKNLANEKLKLSESYIAKIESRRMTPSFSRDQVWHFVEALDLVPPQADLLLEAAGLDASRSDAEEQSIQKRYDLDELLVFARLIRDPDPGWFNVVKAKLNGGARYTYFTDYQSPFTTLVNQLRQAGIRDLERLLECIILPTQFFSMNFAIYVPRGNTKIRYGCGTISESGKAVRFYTMRPSETERLYEQLSRWRTDLNAGEVVPVSAPRRFFPPPREAKSTRARSARR